MPACESRPIGESWLYIESASAWVILPFLTPVDKVSPNACMSKPPTLEFADAISVMCDALGFANAV